MKGYCFLFSIWLFDFYGNTNEDEERIGSRTHFGKEGEGARSARLLVSEVNVTIIIEGRANFR